MLGSGSGVLKYVQSGTTSSYRYTGTDTTYVGKRSSYQQYYVYPAAFGLTSFANVLWVDMVVSFNITNGLKGYTGSAYKYNDYYTGRMPIRVYMDPLTGTIQYFDVGVSTFNTSTDTYARALPSTHGLVSLQYDVTNSSSNIQITPSIKSYILPTSGSNSIMINETATDYNCMEVYPCGYAILA